MLLTQTMDVFGSASQIISNVGFPIAAFLIMVKNNRVQMSVHKEEVEKMQAAFDKRNEAVLQEMKEDNALMRQVIEKNTEVLNQLVGTK